MRTVLVICSVMFLLAGCSTMEVQHSTNSVVKMSSLKSFAWLESTSQDELVREPQPSVDRFIRHAVERELVVKGYSRGEPASADFLLSWFGRLDDKVTEMDIMHFYRSYGYGGALAAAMPEMVEGAAIQRTYKKGTLVIDVIEKESGDIVWHGSATDSIVRKVDEREAGMIINKAVREIMSPFPAR